MLDDAELLRRYAEDKSEAAFAGIVRRHIDLVYGVALRQVAGDAHLAEDIAQQVFAALARKAAALAGRATLSGWLYRSTLFAASDVVRQERRRRAREQEVHAMQEISEPHRSETIEWEQIRPTLDIAIGELGDADRDAVLLRFFEGRSFADVGARLRLSENAARMRVERALDKLHATLSRRGVTSTVAALTIVLAKPAAMSAPASLAASVTREVLASMAPIAANAMTASALMTWGWVKTAVALSGIAVAIVGGVVMRERTRASEAAAMPVVAEPPPRESTRADEPSTRVTQKVPQAAAEADNAAVDVTLVSDGFTWVSVTRVFQPARFTNTTRKLPPGLYEIVGRRKGYRDETVRLQVWKGMPPPTVTVICYVAM